MGNPSSSRRVGRIAGLWRYPVKSMAAETLAQAEVSWFGVAGDRRWAFVRPDVPQSGFPWFTLREQAALNAYRPRFVDAASPDRSRTVVRTPSGAELEVTDPALRQELGGDGLQVIRQDRGIFDTFPLALITTQTIASLSATVGVPLDVQRFRPNLLVEADGDAPWPEDDWVGEVLRIGTMRMRVDKRDGRCVVITIDPRTGERSPAILRAVAQQRGGCLGVYGSTVEPGRVGVGDEVWID
ncbi:MAG: MOSC domain-containing protein [Steroidobacteraceae bacterium]|jgi:hypothetical protein|nr:MOSC domain-containing protein [Steroidobacteraceae bacterium]